ncbi:MAG: molybdopterin-dependent oxidoreductase [Halanaerobiaceae bacterium]
MKERGSKSFIPNRGVANDVHSGLTENQVMIRTLVVMTIPAVLAVFAMGSQAFYNILTALVTALIAHYILKAIDLKSVWQLREATYESAYSPLAAGMIVGLSMGELSPYYVTAFVSALTMVVFKWGQEKYFGRKVVNPAAGAKALVLMGLTLVWVLPDSLTTGMLFYPEHLQYALYTEEGFLGVMELAEQMGFYGTENLSVAQSLILWKAHGWIGGASGIATLASGILLAYWIKLKWRISLSYLLGMTVLSVILGLFTGGNLALRIAFHVFTGSVIFLAFFMATEPQTTPVTFKAQYLFGGVLAFLTLGLQLAGIFGSSFVALAIINPFASYFDRVGEKVAFGKEKRRYSPAESLPTAPDTTSPVLTYDPAKCIKCSRCIKACEEIQGNAVLGYGSRGENIFTTAGLGERGSSACMACGECLEFCPTGALSEKYPVIPLREWETKTVETTCSYCGIGCQLKLYTKDGNIAKARGVDNPPNYSSLCIKGRFGHSYRDQTNRLTHPLIKREGNLEAITWSEALNEIAEKLATYKGSEVGALSSAQNTNEENYLLQKFMRTVVGTNNIDYFSRLIHSPTELGLNGALGAGVMSNSIEEILETDCILIAESEINESHPIVSNYVKQAVNKNNTRLIVISSRESRLTGWADLWLKPQRETEVDWINGLMNIILEKGIYDENYVSQNVENFNQLKKAVSQYTPKIVAEKTGLSRQELTSAAEMFAGAENAALIYNMGLVQHEGGAVNVASLANLALLTSNMGRPNTGIYPLKDQNNDQGTMDMGVVPDYLPGYQKVSDSEIRDKFVSQWGETIPDQPGLNAAQMITAAGSGELKSMILMGESEVFSEPNLGEIKRGLQELDFVVAITPFLNEAAEIADIILPSATFTEKNGTFTNIERRVRRVKKVFAPPEGARIDWEILCALSVRMGYPMNYKHASEIMDEIAKLTPIYGGINYFKLNNKQGIQWPCRSEDSSGTKYIKEPLNGEKKKFMPVEPSFAAKEVDSNYPLSIDTDRILFHFRTGFMDPQVEALKEFIKEPYVEISFQDAQDYDIENGDRIKVSTPFGEIKALCRTEERISSGSVFIPYQFLPFHIKETSYSFTTAGPENNKFRIPRFEVYGCRLEKMFGE